MRRIVEEDSSSGKLSGCFGFCGYWKSKEFPVVRSREVIHELIDGVFHACLILKSHDGTLLIIDTSASDAIALVVRCGVPVYTFDHIILNAGILANTLPEHQMGGSLAQDS